MRTVVLQKSDHDIKHEIPLVLEPTISRFQQQYLKFFHLTHQGKECIITNQKGAVIKDSQVFSFVILRNPKPKRSYHFIENSYSPTTHDRFELRISQGGHFPTSGNAKSVVAAGDIHTNDKGVIIKITDQSGTFYTPTTDPKASCKKATALKAMSILGLPRALFVPFSAPSPLLFGSFRRSAASTTHSHLQSSQSLLPRPYTAARP
jgi:hypothetical protein